MLSTDYILEIAVHSYQSALAAQSGGADRIELCSALQTGGLTPDLGLTHLVLESIALPVHVLIRPRLGNFVYDQSEFKTIIRSIEQCERLNVEGVVVGCLRNDGTIHEAQIQQIKNAAGSLDLTFHRAIDVCSDIYQTLDVLMQYDFDRVLTSGHATTAWEGRSTILKMVNYTRSEKLRIMPGAGVNSRNASLILSDTGACEIHASAKKEFPLEQQDSIGLTFVHDKPFTNRWESDEDEIRKLKAAISIKG